MLLSAEGFELERVKTALEDNSIPCDSVIKDKQLKKQEFINKNSAESDILVPYAAYEKAYDICIGIGAIKEDDTQVLEDAVEQKDSNEPTLDEKFFSCACCSCSVRHRFYNGFYKRFIWLN